MNIETAFNLLAQFNKLPKNDIDTTFLEICSYSGRRFEEICSRILSFYFNPRKEHKLKSLFIDSLFELLNKSEEIRYKEDEIEIFTELYADGKRIDLVIKTPDFVIGIENKINASLYNPLDIYRRRLNKYGVKYTIGLVLSLNKITRDNEKKLIKENCFEAITYFDFFKIIKRNVGQYISTCNQKYLIQLYDFIQTLENMDTLTTPNPELSRFFFEKSLDVDNLIYWYNKHKENVLNIQKNKISDLRERISISTEREWWAWEGWDLGFNSFNLQKPKIGIESSYKATKNGALGEFRIFITTWNIKDWEPYEKILKDMFPNNYLEKPNNRVYLYMDVIDGENEDLILKRLKEYYDLLHKITE